QCREILKKPDTEITEAEKAILAQYEGAGGLNEANRSNAGILNEFYTPNNLVEKVWQIVDHYAPNAKTVLEPSAGVGKFANNRPNNEFTMHELDETSARINKILHPDANIVQGAYQKQFFDESERFHVGSGYKQPKYDIVIGNPPYGEYSDKWKGLGEGKLFDRYEEYFIAKGLDALKDENSLLAFVVPSGFLNTESDKQKEFLATNGKLVDAYRLPEGSFPTTEVGTDIVVFKKWESPKEFNAEYLENKNLLSNGEWFNQHPEKVLGEVKTRTNRFGREEKYVTAHEGLTVQDELNKIDSLLSSFNKVPSKLQRPQKWGMSKKQGELMTSEEFARLYGREFDARVFPIWKATDWQGNIDLEKLSAADIRYMSESGEYVQKAAGVWTHKELFCSGDIYAKIEEQKSLKEAFVQRYGESAVKDMDFDKNIALLESVKKPPLAMDNIHFGLKTPLAESFKTTHIDEDGNAVELNLQESFILWAQNSTLAMGMWRKDIDFASANISREELGETVSFMDIVEYIDGEPVKANALRGWRASKMTEDEKKAEKAERKKEADLKRQTRSDVANRLFDRYLHEGITGETKARLEAEYNRRFNSYIAPDYSKLPLFVDGMSAWKGNSKFKLYDQQIKGISFLCNKGNGLLAYDVGVGKTAAGITATENQMQLGRSKKPLIVVPNQVYSKWYTDIKQLFPKTKINDLYNFGRDSIAKFVDPNDPHKLNLPENSISLCTYEALKNITFKDESCVGPLFEDFKDLLSADFDGSESENAAAKEKIAGVIGVSSQVKNPNYVFFEDCGFDHITVDEAHNFKNLWVVPRPKKKGQSNEYAGIPSGKPSNRALKMFAMTQLVQRNNNDRNVFMLTATPFTNSPTEVYSMISYIGRERLKQSGIDSLRSFFEEFAQTKQELGVTSSGEIDTKQVMKNWKELPALQSILTEFIDKVDGEEAGIIRPNKYTHVKPLDMSELQKEMREIDEARMAGALGVESTSADTIVAMNNMRLSCVAPALANPAMYPGVNLPSMKELVETSPKLKFVCDAIIDMYKENPEKGQFMYVPLGKDSHGIIKDYLVQHGIPKEAVEIINGEINNSVEKKEKITASFNDEKSKLKILIGGRNTAEGIDLNGNSFVMYNCSLGWNPSETVQAEGRIWRQGNLQGNVHIVYPVMNDSIDSVLYQKHDEKISRIGELWSYKGDALNVEDINPEDLKLDLIKDPRKKANLILKEETKGIKAELSSVELKI
ncbi:MAG: Eco57I restriction-modification methylase domain-containing protein, partial [Treponema sp.]|nr:Eco57I restriction-modification methylase domain-containing protein [Treponema sp.]